MIGTLIAKFLKGRWGSILPEVLTAIADGKAGPQAKAVYWFAAGKKTLTGAVLGGIGAALTYVCSSYGATYAWSCTAAHWVLIVGGVLFSVGLVDGGNRAPVPDEPAK